MRLGTACTPRTPSGARRSAMRSRRCSQTSALPIKKGRCGTMTHDYKRKGTEWRAQLSPDEYRVTRQSGTEHPFSSQMCSSFEPGTYSCVCCETVLFDVSEKFESGTGWPSFTQPCRQHRCISP